MSFNPLNSCAIAKPDPEFEMIWPLLLQLASSDETALASRAWNECLFSTAAALEEQGETAADTADAAIIHCDPFRQQYFAAMLRHYTRHGQSGETLTPFLDERQAAHRRELVAFIMDVRRRLGQN